MAKVWVLDTSTKGTGATMVPLESVLRKPGGRSEPIYVPPPRAPKAPAPAEARPKRLFKVIDVRSRQVLAEGATARATIELLGGVRSIVDVNVYVWMPSKGRWRLLSFDEQRLLWSRRDSSAGAASKLRSLVERERT
ncbi:MAG TPA: hypothetical protein VGG41_05800 [Solirubrobacteraceae bacterium]